MTRLAGASVLVTGAAGFVGPYVARELIESGAIAIHGLGNEPPSHDLPLASWQTVDLGDVESLASAVATTAPDLVVHLAGQSSAGRSFEAPIETFAANALGTWHLLESVRRAAPRARTLVVGTGEVYGPQPAGTRVSEEAPFRPLSPYAFSKAAADAFAQVAHAKHGLDVVRVRAFGHTGPGQRPTFVIPSWAAQIAAIERGGAEPIIKVGNLDVVRDLSDVRDVVRGYAALLERGRPGAAYNLCRGEGARLSEVAERLVRRARVPIRIEVDPERVRPADVPYLVGDPARIERDTGWRAEIPLESTLDDVLDHYRRSEL